MAAGDEDDDLVVVGRRERERDRGEAAASGGGCGDQLKWSRGRSCPYRFHFTKCSFFCDFG